MRWYETVSAPWNQIEPERCRSVLIQRASQLVSSREEMCKIRFVGTHERGHGYKYVCTPWSGALFVCPLVQFLWYCLSIVNVLTHIASPPSQLYSQHYITIGSITEWTYSRGPHEMNNLRKKSYRHHSRLEKKRKILHIWGVWHQLCGNNWWYTIKRFVDKCAIFLYFALSANF